MRVAPELTYQDYKESTADAFRLLGRKGHETADTITDWLTDEDDELLAPNSTSLALWIISIGEYEVRHDILEDRVLEQLSFHVPRLQMGKYVDDLSKEEYEQIKADIDYILSKIKLIKLKTYDDDEDE